MTFSGSTHKAASVTGTTSNLHTAEWDASGNLVDSGDTGVVHLTSAGVGGFFLPLVTSEAHAGNNIAYSGTNNQVRVAQFVLASYITVGHVVSQVTVASSGKTFNVGIYDTNGNKLIDSGSLSCTNVATVGATLGSSVTLQPGVYYYAWAATDTVCKGLGYTNGGQQSIANFNATRWGTAANPLSGGNLPSTLGTITATTFDFPIAFIEP